MHPPTLATSQPGHRTRYIDFSMTSPSYSTLLGAARGGMNDEGGDLARLVPLRRRLGSGPRATIQGDVILWYWDRKEWERGDRGDEPLRSRSDEAERQLFTADTPTLLVDFLRLADGPDEEVVAFASEWGALGLCHHGLPVGHRSQIRGIASGIGEWCRELRGTWGGRGAEAESLAAWRTWARVFSHLTYIATQLNQGQSVPSETRDALWNEIAPERGSPRHWYDNVRTDYRLADSNEFSVLVATLAEMCQLAPAIEWVPRGDRLEPKMYLAGNGVLAALVLQLIAVTARAHVAWCSGCGSPYTRRQRPKGGRRNWCDRCKEEGVPAKLGKRRERAGPNDK
jgi:hypothetical protein